MDYPPKTVTICAGDQGFTPEHNPPVGAVFGTNEALSLADLHSTRPPLSALPVNKRMVNLFDDLHEARF